MKLFAVITIALCATASAMNLSVSTDCMTAKPRFGPGMTIDSHAAKLVSEISGADHSTILLEFLPFAELDGSQISEYLRWLNDIVEAYPGLSAIISVDGADSPSIMSLYNNQDIPGFCSRLAITGDSSGLAREFGITKDCYMALLIDSSNTVQFTSNFPMNYQTVHQLAKNYGGKLCDEAAISDTLNLAFFVGKSVPEIEIADLQTNEQMNLRALAKESVLCLLFSASCSQCQIRSFLLRIGRSESLITQSTDRKVICLIDGDIQPGIIAGYVKAYNISLPVFMTKHFANSPARHFEMEGGERQSQVLTWDNDGTLRRAEPFDAFLDRLK
ncbi:MAG: hypothetical protein PHR28_07630 [candidate division Zixibacteria bacterium]|nr:hypothetical protein [candidate division Zixibacteria bacterium]